MGVNTTPRVLMIGPSLDSRGGMATVERQLVDCLSSDNVDIRFISTYDDCSNVKKAFIALGAYAKFCRSLKDVDIVHVHMASRGSYERKSFFLRKAIAEGKRTVIHLHGGEFGVWFDDEMDSGKRDEVRSLFGKVDVVVVLSEEWQNWLLDRDFRVKKLLVLHNAVPVPKESCSPCSHQDVLFLGRLDARKSPDVLLRASRKMLNEHPDARLLFGGDGFTDRYVTLSEELGISRQCEFLGWVTGSEKENLFKRAGVYCLPSKNEGMPMSVLEAMAHGIPTIATPVGGVPQIINDGFNGFIMPVDDEDTLSSILCNLADSPHLRSEIGASGRETILNYFSIERNIETLKQLYWELAL